MPIANRGNAWQPQHTATTTEWHNLAQGPGLCPDSHSNRIELLEMARKIGQWLHRQENIVDYDVEYYQYPSHILHIAHAKLATFLG